MTEPPTATPPTFSRVRLATAGAVAELTLARTEKLNALDRQVLEELAAAIAWVDAQPAVKVLVVAAEGPHFSAGFDLSDPAWAELGDPEHAAAAGRTTVTALGSARPITVASIRGHCIGGGLVLAAACDLRMASTTATFRIPEVDLGVPLYWSGVPRLVRELGPALTKELVLTGRRFDAAEAATIRFVNRVVPDDQLDRASRELAQQLASKPALVLETTKRQVEEAAPPVPSTDTADVDLAGYRAAFADQECRDAAATYRQRQP